MIQKKSNKRSVSGILLLNKPLSMSSNAALQRVKYLFQAKKAGHTGSLDPLASGLLPLCFGEATKFSQYLLDSDKTYQVAAKLGVRTTTSDREGEIVAEKPVPDFTIEMLDKAFDDFRGEIQQVPSMFSALKYKGQPLYKLAREGIVVERESRQLTIHYIHLLKYENNTIYFEVKCTKGTYVRTLVDDLGEKLGCGAHVTELHRIGVGPYSADEMITIEQLEKILETSDVKTLDALLLPPDTSVAHWPAVSVSSSTAFYLQQGNPVMAVKLSREGMVRVYLDEKHFIGIAEVGDNGMLAPRRLVGR